MSSVHKFTISLFSTFKTLAFAAILCIDIVSTTISTIICTFQCVIDIITIVISSPSLVTAYSELEKKLAIHYRNSLIFQVGISPICKFILCGPSMMEQPEPTEISKSGNPQQLVFPGFSIINRPHGMYKKIEINRLKTLALLF